MNDHVVFTCYILNSAVNIYGFCLFLWWMLRTRFNRLSAVYVYVMFLMGGIGFKTIIESYAFFHRVFGCYTVEELNSIAFDRWFWYARLLVPFVFSLCIVVHMTARAVRSYRRDVS